MRNPSYNFNKEIAEDDYGKMPYMVQMIETSHKKITEVIQTEFERKGSQLKARITAYCAYEQRKIVQGEISVTYTDKYHDRETQVLLAEHSINEFLDRSAGVIDADIEAYLNNGSGWKLLRIEMIYIEFYKYERTLGGSWKETPKGLSNKKVTINPNNRTTGDNLCLGYALGLHFLHYENDGIVKNPQNLSKIRPYISRINLEGIPMPTPICPRVFEKIEKQNPEISVNVWEWNENKQSPKCVIYSKNHDHQHNIHLIALSETVDEVTDFKIKHHYIWVKDINRLLYGDTAHKGKKHFCNKCTQTFPCKERLDMHRMWCYGMDNTSQKVTLPKADGINNFEKFKNYE
ncbi:hypothetical protein RhiirB3_449077 [Rhizophagus irregularis]|nr:hypothetical protein RhiirB3_449077 [Rhizophagus irregularis]